MRLIWLTAGLIIVSGLSACQKSEAEIAREAELDRRAKIETAPMPDDWVDIGRESDSSPSSVAKKPSQSKWSYSEGRDELRDATTYQASIRSNNYVNFGFPYEGDSRLTLIIRKSPAFGRDVIFIMDNGQLMCGIYDCKYSISFDGSAENLTLAPSSDGDSKILFAKYPEAIIRKLKASDNAIVELQFYQEGNRQFKFDTANLEWEH